MNNVQTKKEIHCTLLHEKHTEDDVGGDAYFMGKCSSYEEMKQELEGMRVGKEGEVEVVVKGMVWDERGVALVVSHEVMSCPIPHITYALRLVLYVVCGVVCGVLCARGVC